MTGNVKSMTASSSINELALVSLFGRIMYSYDDRYLLSASIRRDGSSRFKKGHQFGSFPSASIGWNTTVRNSSNHWKMYLTNSNFASATVN